MKTLTLVLILCGAAAAWADASNLTETHDAAPALREAARKLFGESVGASPLVTRVAGFERFSEGFSYEIYEVRKDGGGAAQRLVRLQVHPDATSQIDLALKADHGKVLDVFPLRPVLFEGKPFAELPALITGLSKRPMRAVGPGLARFFHGLEFLDAAYAGPRPPPPPPSPGAPPPPPLLTARQPALAPGSPLPDFAVKSLAGVSLTPRRLAGRPLLVVFASLRNAKGREVLETCARLITRQTAVAFVGFVPQTPGEAGPLLPTGPDGRVAERLAPDADGAIAKAFQVAAPPVLFLFDRSGKLVTEQPYPGPAVLERQLMAMSGVAPAPAAGSPRPPPPPRGVKRVSHPDAPKETRVLPENKDKERK